MSEILLLNADFIPLELISKEESVKLLYLSKAYTLIESEKTISSPSITIKIPNVLCLIAYKKIPKRVVNFSRLSVVYRDDCKCQYCGKQFSMKDLTIDHIIPRSRWKEVKRTSKKDFTNFLNCVAACKWCNNKKGNKLLSEMKDMHLLRKPYVPTYIPKIVVSYEKAHRKGWIPFSKFNIRLIYS